MDRGELEDVWAVDMLEDWDEAIAEYWMRARIALDTARRTRTLQAQEMKPVDSMDVTDMDLAHVFVESLSRD